MVHHKCRYTPRHMPRTNILFIIMINVLKVQCSTIKFVDNTTIYFTNTKKDSHQDSMQQRLNEVSEWNENNNMQHAVWNPDITEE